METNNNEVWREYMPDYVGLYYVDYRSDLDGHMELVQQCVKSNSLDALHEEVLNWWDFPEESYLDDIEEAMKADGLLEEFERDRDAIVDWLYENDKSDPVSDLLRNTKDIVFFYSLGVELDGWHDDWCGSYRGESESMSAYKIRKALKLKKGGPGDEAINEMIQNASYGGELRLYFNASVEDLVTNADKDFQSISFKGQCHVAIANSNNGSGYDTVLDIDISLPFDRANLFIDECVKYSYSFDVCGMVSNWCKGTSFQMSYEKVKNGSKLKKSSMNEYLDQEAEYIKTFKAGACSAGDMNMNRHRNVTYINEFPCGNRCPHCGTFWID